MKSVKLNPDEGAIIITPDGVKFFFPESNTTFEALQTIGFLKYALENKKWIQEWYDYLDAEFAIADLATKPPQLVLIRGGKNEGEP